jgi:hypothetical protein
MRHSPMGRNACPFALEVLKRAFIDRDPTVIEEYFDANYKQRNPVIPDGPSAIANMIPNFTGLTYEPGIRLAFFLGRRRGFDLREFGLPTRVGSGGAVLFGSAAAQLTAGNRVCLPAKFPELTPRG